MKKIMANCFLKKQYFKKDESQPELIFQIYDLDHETRVISLKVNLKTKNKIFSQTNIER